MPVTVEFFGIPRTRAGVAQTTASGSSLGDVLIHLAGRFPRLAETCIDRNNLRAGFVANLDGEQFVTDPKTKLADGARVLLLSLDAGG